MIRLNDAIPVVIADLLVRHMNALRDDEEARRAYIYEVIKGLRSIYPDEVAAALEPRP